MIAVTYFYAVIDEVPVIDEVIFKPMPIYQDWYVHNGQPACLVARILVRMGWTVEQLKLAEGDRPESANPVFKDLLPLTRRFLTSVQIAQEYGLTWHRIRNEVARVLVKDPYYWTNNTNIRTCLVNFRYFLLVSPIERIQ